MGSEIVSKARLLLLKEKLIPHPAIVSVEFHMSNIITRTSLEAMDHEETDSNRTGIYMTTAPGGEKMMETVTDKGSLGIGLDVLENSLAITEDQCILIEVG